MLEESELAAQLAEARMANARLSEAVASLVKELESARKDKSRAEEKCAKLQEQVTAAARERREAWMKAQHEKRVAELGGKGATRVIPGQTYDRYRAQERKREAKIAAERLNPQ